MGSLDRLVHYWNVLKTSALSKANYMTSALSSSREVDVLEDGAAGVGGDADQSSTGSSESDEGRADERTVVSDVLVSEGDDYAMPWSMLDDPASYACEQQPDVQTEAGMMGGLRLSYQRLSATMKDSFENVVLGSRLLGGDVKEASVLISRKLSGRSLTARQVDKIRRMGSDVAVLIPIATVLALPITAVGHTMFLAAIQRYSPWMIPTAFREDRLQRLRQLDALKSRDAQDPSAEKGDGEDGLADFSPPVSSDDQGNGHDVVASA